MAECRWLLDLPGEHDEAYDETQAGQRHGRTPPQFSMAAKEQEAIAGPTGINEPLRFFARTLLELP